MKLLPLVLLAVFSTTASAKDYYQLQSVWDPYRHCYVQKYVKVFVQELVPNSYHYEYNINYAQPAAVQGTTVYGHRQDAVLDLSIQSYGDVDNGALLDYATRSRDSADRLAGQVASNQLSAQTLISADNAGVLGVAKLDRVNAFVDSLSNLADKLDKDTFSLRLSQSAGTDGSTFKTQQAFVGPLLKQHCAACHGDASTNKAAKDAFVLGSGDRAAAISAVINGSMPKGQSISAEARVELLKELQSQPNS